MSQTKKKGATKKTAPKKTSTKTKNPVTQTEKTMEITMTQGKVQFDKLAQEAANASKEQVTAFMQSGGIFMRGFEDIVKTYVSLTQTTAEKNSQAAKKVLGCKDLTELTEIQSKLAQQNFDDFMAGATKLTELTVKVTTDAFAPINDQLGKTIKKATSAAA